MQIQPATRILSLSPAKLEEDRQKRKPLSLDLVVQLDELFVVNCDEDNERGYEHHEEKHGWLGSGRRFGRSLRQRYANKLNTNSPVMEQTE